MNKIHIPQPVMFILKGFCMGTADVIPGVSGGTMAYILGIYTRLVNAIKSFDLQWLQAVAKLDRKNIFDRPDFALVVPLGFGIFLALMFFTRVISLPGLLNTYPEMVNAFFFGLIAGSIYILLRHAGKITLKDLMFVIFGLISGMIVFNLVPVNTPETGWFIFISGALAICAMILPGISGSFILLLLKKYDYIFTAIGYFDFSILIPFILGIVTGLILFARFLSWLLDNFYRATIMVINGLLVASLWVIWPYQERVYEVVGKKLQLISTSPYLPGAFTELTLVVLVLTVTGIVIVLFINRLAENISVDEE